MTFPTFWLISRFATFLSGTFLMVGRRANRTLKGLLVTDNHFVAGCTGGVS